MQETCLIFLLMPFCRIVCMLSTAGAGATVERVNAEQKWDSGGKPPPATEECN